MNKTNERITMDEIFVYVLVLTLVAEFGAVLIGLEFVCLSTLSHSLNHQTVGSWLTGLGLFLALLNILTMLTLGYARKKFCEELLPWIDVDFVVIKKSTDFCVEEKP